MRIWQYLPCLEAAGFEIVAQPLLPDSYVSNLQAGRRDLGETAAAYARQVLRLLRRRPYDLIWIEKEVLPWVPLALERLLLPRVIPRVIDYDDAVYHLYEAHPRRLVRAFLKEKHASAMRRAATVVAGSAALADRARSAGAANVVIVPTVVDLDRYPPPQPAARDHTVPRICWIGQQSTASFLTLYRRLFASFRDRGEAEFVAIGIDAAALDLPMRSVPWSEAEEVAAISACDIGIMPLADGAFERGKCGYKLIQYMACGLPVVASAVGANRDIVRHGVNGFLAGTEEEWRDALRTLAADPALRARMGAAGRRRVEEEYSLQVAGPRMAEILRAAAGRSHRA